MDGMVSWHGTEALMDNQWKGYDDDGGCRLTDGVAASATLAVTFSVCDVLGANGIAREALVTEPFSLGPSRVLVYSFTLCAKL